MDDHAQALTPCPLCGTRVTPPPRLPPLSTMTLGEAWLVLKHSALYALVVALIFGLPMVAIYGLSAGLSVDTWWAGMPSALKYLVYGVAFSWAAAAGIIGDFVARTGKLLADVGWSLQQLSRLGRVVLSFSLAAFAVGVAYFPWVVTITGMVMFPFGMALDQWADRAAVERGTRA